MTKSIKIYQLNKNGKEKFLCCTEVITPDHESFQTFQNQLLEDNIRIEFL